MLAVVKEPHIELSLGGGEEQIMELLEFLRSRYSVQVLSASEDEDGEELEDIVDTDFWKENATPGRMLAGYRLKHEMTQRQLAEKCGMHAGVISLYESGKRKITPCAARKMAKALGENPESFLVE